MSKLDDIKVGDEVAWVSSSYYRQEIKIAKVEAASKRYLLVLGQRFRRDGKLVGADRHYAPHLLPCIEHVNSQNAHAAGISYLRDFKKWGDLTGDQIARIRAILEEDSQP